MQATTAPAPALAPGTPTATTTTSDGKVIPLSVPQSETDVAALLSRRNDIRDEMNAASNRRRSIVNEIRSSPEGVARSGLEQRVALIDKGLLQMENELTNISNQLDAAPAELIPISRALNPNQEYDRGFDDGVGAGIGGSTVFLAALFGYLWLRRRRKRKKNPEQNRTADSPRLERVEQAVEAIAIEVERISEGQRFVTRLLSESPEGALVKNRIAQPAAASQQ